MQDDCKILWAEDDDEDIYLISQAAQELGVDHLIDFAPTGRDVIDKLLRSALKKSLPDLIVLDNNMPVMSGMEVLNEIHEYELLGKVPVVFFTTSKVQVADNKLQQHARFYIKPPSYAMYFATIKAILELRQSLQ